jgi:hypothetical protein
MSVHEVDLPTYCMWLLFVLLTVLCHVFFYETLSGLDYGLL